MKRRKYLLPGLQPCQIVNDSCTYMFFYFITKQENKNSFSNANTTDRQAPSELQTGFQSRLQTPNMHS